jgi:hypothetical protein
MNIALWIVQALLALLLISGGGYKFVSGAELAAQIGALAPATWRVLGVVEVIGGLLIVLPWALRWMPQLTSLAAMVLLVEALWLSVVYGRESLALGFENPLVFSVAMAVMLAFVAYGRFIARAA